MLLIETDPDHTLIETSVKFESLIEGDIFRKSNTSYNSAIDDGEIFMCIESKEGKIVINLHTGYQCNINISADTRVIVHLAKLVVMPNI